jgi:hypothetical protein
MSTKTLVGILVVFAVVGFGAYISLGQSRHAFTQEDAIDAVIAQHPELAAYKTTSLPPSSIETKKQIDGWSVAFVQRGSGVPGILQAQCYHVNIDGTMVQATGQYARHDNIEATTVALENCTPNNVPAPQENVLPYGSVTLQVGSTAQFKDISIKPIVIVEDSRCPVDVQCITAGTVRVKIEVVTSSGASLNTVSLDKPLTTERFRITLASVALAKNSKVTIGATEYNLVFSVVPQSLPLSPSAKCHVGGCSSQLCSDQPDVVSNCMYQESYACYKTATCERQTNGQCGWTQTPQLTSCLSNAQ